MVRPRRILFFWSNVKSNLSIGVYAVTIDGGTPVVKDGSASTILYQQLLFSASGLNPGTHVVELRNTPENPSSPTGVDVDLILLEVGDGKTE
jgi:hypothetical protein